MDKRTIAIYILIIVVVFLIGYIGAIKFKQSQEEREQAVYEEALRLGRLLEQQSVINQLQSTGFYSLTFVDETNQTKTIHLSILQQSPQLPGQEITE